MLPISEAAVAISIEDAVAEEVIERRTDRLDVAWVEVEKLFHQLVEGLLKVAHLGGQIEVKVCRKQAVAFV